MTTTNNEYRPTLTIDSLASAAIAFYITSSNDEHARDAFAKFDDDDLTIMTIDELRENELLLDIFDDSTSDARIAQIMRSPRFATMIMNAYTMHREFIAK